ncbi:amino acid adenylation domain-containing protein [Undibacterium sp. LX40W]|uniref:Amino acid adenylation domain-containing protein n=1 Tax=Undibacterium nitidum TaxID=2762298 RepID=A0A923HJC4_9BURK|nr:MULTISPECIES: Pls/PosA family non-ribosomal peptide synthetase [Undibacterium]MBC3880122.1 amino acid adenylation domain-containing protein [Undibacterium nitidum]MBC3891142.1 amino acid adenylation domain-containing protein [Undibacterium sp. LX40W]
MNQPENQQQQKADTATAILYGPDRPDLLRDECLADLINVSVKQYPQKIALSSGERTLTYAELGQLTDRVAAHLFKAGLRPGHIIGLWMARGVDLLVMQAAIAKTGAAWLPFDADVPVDRIEVCLQDANAFGLLTQHSSLHDLASLSFTIFIAEDLLAQNIDQNLELPRAKESDPAYVIYTSGSTGKPKGIVITQGSICQFLRSENSVLGICSSDRVYQGFSVAFDMSFEEIWISYLVGATLWIAPKEVALDPDALPRALIENQITVLHAVPTLLALFSIDVPCLRLINLGGEMCPPSLVERWATPQRQMFNTYGPTEATVSASLAPLSAGAPVTIGIPLPNYGLLVIDPEVDLNSGNGLRLLPRGETGELCIFGPGVSAGYLGRPDLTAEKFLDNPWATSEKYQRLYRTGDLARIGEDGSVQCLGRADDQVKIRGFRVELGEIEAVLAKQEGIGTVAVILRQEQGIDQLIAFIVRESGFDLETIAESIHRLRLALSQVLPAYMVPSRYEFLDEMPRLSSGKIDRKTLKASPLTVQEKATDGDVPENEAEQLLFDSLARLFPGQALRRGADFFDDLGGHSLMAARLVSALRQDPRYAYFKISDIYQSRSLGKIASVMQAGAIDVNIAKDAQLTWAPVSDLKRWICGAAQAVMIPCLVAIRMLQWLAPFFAYHFFTGEPSDSIPVAIGFSILIFLGVTVAEFFFAIAAKWVILGRLKPGIYPMWGVTYFRWWLVDRIIEAVPIYMLNGSSLYNWWLRAMGAKLGKEVLVGSMTLRAPDCLQLDDGVSIGNACNFENVRVEHGEMRVGQICLGQNAYVGSYSVLEGDTTLEAFAHLEGQSALVETQCVPQGRIWSGSPARDVGAFVLDTDKPRAEVSGVRKLGEGIYFLLGSLLVTALFFLPVFPSFMLIDFFDSMESLEFIQKANVEVQLIDYFMLAFPATAVLVICTALLSAGIRWAFLGRLKPGSYPVHSNTYCRKWFVNQIQESSLNVLHGVYATIYSPFWYRLLGAKVGKGAEVSTALGVVPDMLTLGDECFIADAVMLGDEEIDQGWMTVQATTVSRRSFVGNGAYVPDGTVIPENVLIGVHTSAPTNAKMKPGDTWIGSPAMLLPAREEVKGFAENLTFKPSLWRKLARGLIEAFRIIAPHALVIAIGYVIVLDLMPLAAEERWAEVFYYLVVSGLLYGAGCFVFVAALKWILIFKYKQSSHPMWTWFVWSSEAITNLYEGITVPNFMRYLKGTPWLPLAFNLLGAKIGKGVYMDTTDITEFDCVSIGDYSEINAAACPQTHLFEDRVMKVDHVKIGDRVYLGPRSFVLYGAQVGDDAKLGSLTLVMKGEFIPAGSSWRGCPASIG